MRPGLRWLGLAVGLSVTHPIGVAATDRPFADVHLHYNWDHSEQLTVREAIDRLRRQRVSLAVVSSTPPENALKLRAAGGDWIVPLFRPYLKPGKRHSWFNDPAVLPAARRALASGKYRGIGEFHLIAGLGPDRRNRILHGLIKLGIEYQLPILIHTEASSYRYFLPLCRRYPRARFLWAHAGGILDARQVGRLIQACRNVWVEFSARDNWRYLQSPITDRHGRLLPAWLQLIRTYPDRFMVGTDPVYPVDQLTHWEVENTGWQRIGDFIAYHRRWLRRLPVPLEKKLRLGNAQRFFKNRGRRINGPR